MKIQIDNLGKVAITVEEDYWSNNKCYDKLVIVEVAGVGAYLSRKPVPKGTKLSNRKYWVKISGNSGYSIPISQSLGYDEEVAISQKIITDEIDKINRRIDEIIHGNIQVDFTITPTSINVGEYKEVTLSVVCEESVEKIVIKDAQGNVIGDEGSGTEHSVTTTVHPTVGGTTIPYKAEVTINSIIIRREANLIVNLLDSSISWSSASATVTIGGVYNLPTFNNPNNLSVTFSSNNTEVASVDSSGNVTIHSIGSAIISAEFYGNDIYAPKKVTYSLTVEEVKLPVFYGSGKTYNNINWINTQSTGLPDNFRISPTIETEGDYIFFNIPKNATLRNVYTYNELPQWRYPVEVSLVAENNNYNTYRTSDNDGWAVGTIELILNQNL